MERQRSVNQKEKQMPAGISAGKARRNSKTKAGPSRAKLGLSAKAGKRKPGGARRKRQREYGTGYVMGDTSKKTYKPNAETLARGLFIIRNMERTNMSNSDPFRWNRLRTHFKNGLVDIDYLTDR